MSTLDADAIYKALCTDLDNAYCKTSVGGNFPPVESRWRAIEIMRDKFLSKLEPRQQTPAQKQAAIDEFDLSNSLAMGWKPMTSGLNDHESELVGTFLKYFNDFWECDYGPDCDLNWGNVALHARCGPGASFGGSGTSFYQKMYSGPLTASSPYILALYKADINLWPEETIAEQIRAETYGPPSLTGRSKLTFVPKTVKTSRLIAVEPTLNVFYQLGVAEILSKRLVRCFGIDLSTQPDVNRQLARLGSVIDASFGDGYSTIDLTSASDGISLSLAGYSIPAGQLDVLLGLRSAYAQVDKDLGSIRELHMLSTMGNGFTFPLQTALFAAATAAAVALGDDILAMPKAWSDRNPGGLYSVFGDDIVVTTKAAHRLLWLLEWLGFRPNKEKCFTSGEFRESCGFDFHRGFNVRPVFLKQFFTEQDVLVCANRVVDWAARCLVPVPTFLKHVASLLKRVYYVPLGSGLDTGLLVPYSLVRGLKRDPDVQSVAYYHFEPKPDRARFKWGGKPSPRDSARGFISNPSGLYLSMLRGELRGGCISLRANAGVKYKVRRSVVPWWDHRPYTLQGWFDDYSVYTSYPVRLAWVLEGNLPKLKLGYRALKA